MNKSKIEWCDSTWNPVSGCLHDCPYCYAKKIAERFKPNQADTSLIFAGTEKKPIIISCEEYELTQQFRGSNGRVMAYPFGFAPTFHKYRLDEYKNKSARTIFVCSMADLFGDWVPEQWIDDVFAACAEAPQHRYLFLTKNPKRYIELAEKGKLPTNDNMWYGSTATDDNMPFFYSEEHNTFVSVEPIQEEIHTGTTFTENIYTDWIIVGAETGKRKDKVVPQKEWIEIIVDTCKAGNIPLFMKDSLIPIIGEENMVREFPWSDEKK